MAWKQIKGANLNQTDYPGWCLRFTRNVFGIPSRWDYATQAWNASPTQHTDALPDAIVPVWFYWYGTVDGLGTGNWGDVAVWVPGKGVFGTPLKGGGNSNRWWPTVEARAAAIGGQARYLGWTEDLNGVRIVEHVADPAPTPPPTPPVKQLSDYSTDELVRELVRRYK